MLEAVHIMGIAEVIQAALAVPAFAAGNDLLGDHPVADLEAAGHLAPDFHNPAEEFMARGEGRLHVGRHAVAAPEARHGVRGLDVARADAAALNLQKDVLRADFRHGDLFQRVFARPVGDERSHGLRYVHMYLHRVPAKRRQGRTALLDINSTPIITNVYEKSI